MGRCYSTALKKFTPNINIGELFFVFTVFLFNWTEYGTEMFSLSKRPFPKMSNSIFCQFPRAVLSIYSLDSTFRISLYTERWSNASHYVTTCFTSWYNAAIVANLNIRMGNVFGIVYCTFFCEMAVSFFIFMRYFLPIYGFGWDSYLCVYAPLVFEHFELFIT